MAYTSAAIASPRLMYAGISPTTGTVVYTAPNYSANVTSPSATAYIKEIIICNTTSSSITVSVVANNVNLVSGLTINANDTKPLTGLNTMLGAATTIQVICSATNAAAITISGVEVQ